MELVYDWKGYQSLFLQKRRMPFQVESDTELSKNAPGTHPIYLVVDQGKVLSIFCESEDLSTWVGGSEKELTQTLTHRTWLRFELAQVENWLQESLSCPHFPEEINFLKQKAYLQYPDPKKNHFVLSATQGWWNKLVPTTYGVYIRINDGRSLLLTIQRKQLVSFQVPDLSGLTTDRQKKFPEVIQLLSERYLLPIQGFSLTKEEWQEWMHSPHPWPSIIRTLRTQKEKVFPYKWGLMGLISLRAYFRI